MSRGLIKLNFTILDTGEMGSKTYLIGSTMKMSWTEENEGTNLNDTWLNSSLSFSRYPFGVWAHEHLKMDNSSSMHDIPEDYGFLYNILSIR